MPGDTWRNPHNPPVPLQGHPDSADVSNEAPTADQTRIFVTVNAGAKVRANDFAYNCLGWVCFKGPAAVRSEPDFEFVDNLTEVEATLIKNGYVACPAAEATCIVTGTGNYEIGHVYAKWQGLADVTDPNWLATWGAVDWWESRLGPAGVTIIHERDALTGNTSYSNQLAYFKPR